jgi:hypothetical protein
LFLDKKRSIYVDEASGKVSGIVGRETEVPLTFLFNKLKKVKIRYYAFVTNVNN